MKETRQVFKNNISNTFTDSYVFLKISIVVEFE